MKFPEHIGAILARRFQAKYREWLLGEPHDQWPLEITLGVPSEQVAQQQMSGVQAWVSAWHSWRGAGTLIWCERRWRILGLQKLPEKILLQNPVEIATWCGQTQRWLLACARYEITVSRWPVLRAHLGRQFDVLADYSETDFQRLLQFLEWIIKSPASGLYLRQLPIAGLDTKWVESRKVVVSDLVSVLRDNGNDDQNFYRQCGLKAPPIQIRMRILDQHLRALLGGLSDIVAPVSDIGALKLVVPNVLIVENLQTGLALPDMPGTVVFMGLGYGIDLLAEVKWIANARVYYWGDLDTHGFAILHRARFYFPNLESILMDEETLSKHQALWGTENKQHGSTELTLLRDGERLLYANMKQQRWSCNIRLEQERIEWGYALNTIHAKIFPQERALILE